MLRLTDFGILGDLGFAEDFPTIKHIKRFLFLCVLGSFMSSKG